MTTTVTTSALLLGDPVVHLNADSLPAGEAEAFPFRARASGIARDVRVFIDAHNAASTLIAGVYTSFRGRPGTLLTAGSLSFPRASTWNTVPIASVPLVAGTGYWLAVLGRGGTLRYRDRIFGRCQAAVSAQANLGALAPAWSTGALLRTCPISAYVTAASPVSQPPVNTAPPAIAGSATLRQTLSSTRGAWTGSPTSFAYQWQDCDSGGSRCSNLSGTTATTYALGAGDVGRSVRVVVTAANGAGGTPAASASVGPVSAPAPTASFTYTPAAPAVGGVVSFDGTSSSCPSGPCTYAWSEDGGPAQPLQPASPLGSGATLSYMFAEAGTKYVRLVLTDAVGQTATAEHSVVVEASPRLPEAPVNTAPPTIAGIAALGQTLSSASGTWTGSPTSFVYQWQDCDTAGNSCTDIAGATGSIHRLGVGDVGHRLRVVVTAANAGGATPARSASVGPVSAPTPTASFTYTPTSPLAGQPVTLDGTSSTCPNGPCTYEWSDDGGPTRPLPPILPLGSGATLSLTFSQAGTKYVRLVVSDALGQTATVEHNVVVEPSAPPPEAPRNTALPSVGGTAQVGQTLTATTGSWSGSAPIHYAFQWQQDGVANIAGATGSSYRPLAADVGHKLDVVVTASNSAGSASAASPQTAAVTEGGAQSTNCFAVPSACGYPDATNSGVPAGTMLTPRTQTIHVTSAGTTISGLELHGSIEVEANNVTIKNDKIVNGDGFTQGAHAVRLYRGFTGLKIEDTTIEGGNCTSEALEMGIETEEPGATANRIYGNCASSIMHGPGREENSYSIDNGTIWDSAEHKEEAHYETWYLGGGSLTAIHNTLLNPHGHTAVIFTKTDFANVEEARIENNLLAGGGFTIYGGEGGLLKVVGPTIVKGNRFARCLTKQVSRAGGTWFCEGGPDSHGYFPKSGDYGEKAFFNKAVTIWSGNVWDDNNESIPCIGCL
jgi:hypothetical protein